MGERQGGSKAIYGEIIRKSYEQNMENVRPCLGHLYCKFNGKDMVKSSMTYSGPFWSYNVSICLWEKTKLLISMIPGFLNVSLRPKTNIIYLWRPHDIFTNPRKSRFIFEIIIINLKMLKIKNRNGKGGRRKSRRLV